MTSISASTRIFGETLFRTTPGSSPRSRSASRAGLRLEPFEVLLAELRDLRRDHDLAVRLVLVVPVVLLVVVLGDVEPLERRNLGDYGVVPEALGLQLRDELLGDAALVLVVVEDGGAVLRPDVRALPIQRRGVVDGEEDLQDLPERDHLRIERDLHDLRVSRGPGNDLAVSRVRDRAARVPGLDALYAPQLVVDGLEAPEAPATERGDLGHRSAPFPRMGYSGVILSPAAETTEQHWQTDRFVG